MDRSDGAGTGGIGVSLDKRPGRKVYKTRVHYKGRVIDLGRFGDLHSARLAYDQAVLMLGKTATLNYPHQQYELSNPAVTQKIEAFLGSCVEQVHLHEKQLQDGSSSSNNSANPDVHVAAAATLSNDTARTHDQCSRSVSRANSPTVTSQQQQQQQWLGSIMQQQQCMQLSGAAFSHQPAFVAQARQPTTSVQQLAKRYQVERCQQTRQIGLPSVESEEQQQQLQHSQVSGRSANLMQQQQGQPAASPVTLQQQQQQQRSEVSSDGACCDKSRAPFLPSEKLANDAEEECFQQLMAMVPYHSQQLLLSELSGLERKLLEAQQQQQQLKPGMGRLLHVWLSSKIKQPTKSNSHDSAASVSASASQAGTAAAAATATAAKGVTLLEQQHSVPVLQQVQQQQQQALHLPRLSNPAAAATAAPWQLWSGSVLTAGPPMNTSRPCSFAEDACGSVTQPCAVGPAADTQQLAQQLAAAAAQMFEAAAALAPKYSRLAAGCTAAAAAAASGVHLSADSNHRAADWCCSSGSGAAAAPQLQPALYEHQVAAVTGVITAAAQPAPAEAASMMWQQQPLLSRKRRLSYDSTALAAAALAAADGAACSRPMARSSSALHVPQLTALNRSAYQPPMQQQLQQQQQQQSVHEAQNAALALQLQQLQYPEKQKQQQQQPLYPEQQQQQPDQPLDEIMLHLNEAFSSQSLNDLVQGSHELDNLISHRMSIEQILSCGQQQSEPDCDLGHLLEDLLQQTDM